VKKITGVDMATGQLQYGDENDPRYQNVCVEMTDFAPILFEDVKQRILDEGGVIGFTNGNYNTAT
jgi:predicted rRNA methylase YqxC with S4 and FtsJ domains